MPKTLFGMLIIGQKENVDNVSILYTALLVKIHYYDFFMLAQADHMKLIIFPSPTHLTFSIFENTMPFHFESMWGKSPIVLSENFVGATKFDDCSTVPTNGEIPNIVVKMVMARLERRLCWQFWEGFKELEVKVRLLWII